MTNRLRPNRKKTQVMCAHQTWWNVPIQVWWRKGFIDRCIPPNRKNTSHVCTSNVVECTHSGVVEERLHRPMYTTEPKKNDKMRVHIERGGVCPSRRVGRTYDRTVQKKKHPAPHRKGTHTHTHTHTHTERDGHGRGAQEKKEKINNGYRPLGIFVFPHT